MKELIEIVISSVSDIYETKREAKIFSETAGFSFKETEEIILVVSELASNIVKHAGNGRLVFRKISNGLSTGIEIESKDSGPGIGDIENAITDGFSTNGSLGYGLGTVNRLMDEINIESLSESGLGTRIICKKWRKPAVQNGQNCPLDIGVATRPHPGMHLNGDAFVIKRWNESVLVGVIDGLGHGQFAHRASQKAAEYLSNHYVQPFDEIFRGVGRNCYATRGVVMALARFDWKYEKMTFASVGNIETRVFGDDESIGFIVRRGIIGLNAPRPVVSEYKWNLKNIMVMFSDGLKTHWKWQDFFHIADKPSGDIAGILLHLLARDNDDATIVVIKEKVR